MSYDLREQWLLAARRLSEKKGGDLCKLTRQKAKANHFHILPRIIIVMFVNSKIDKNVKDPKGISFGRDHHVLHVIPDRYPATVSRTNNLNKKIATWNVRTMYQSGKMDNIMKEVKRMKSNILDVCEVRWAQSGKLASEGTTGIYSRGTDHKHGVGTFLDGETAKCISGF